MVTYEYAVTVWPEGTTIGRGLHGTVMVAARSEELAEAAVYQQILDKWGYSPQKDGVVNLSLYEMEGVEQ